MPAKIFPGSYRKSSAYGRFWLNTGTGIEVRFDHLGRPDSRAPAKVKKTLPIQTAGFAGS
jgi:hypothetical protein